MSGPQSTSHKTNSPHISPSGSSRIFMWQALQVKKVSLDFPICIMIIPTSKCHWEDQVSLIYNFVPSHTQSVSIVCTWALSHVWLCDSWNVVHEALLSMGFSRQDCWSELPFPSPGNLLHLGIEAMSPALPGGFFPEPSGKPCNTVWRSLKSKNRVTIWSRNPTPRLISGKDEKS